MIDESIIPAVGASLAGIGISAGFVAFMERAAAKSANKLDEKVVAEASSLFEILIRLICRVRLVQENFPELMA